MPSVPAPIAALVRSLEQAGHAVWLIGSRADGTASAASDWDLLVFGDAHLLEQLSSAKPVDGVDLLVVHDGNAFISPWNKTKDGAIKSGSLSGWEWKEVSSHSATYSGTKWPNDWGSPRKALKLSNESVA